KGRKRLPNLVPRSLFQGHDGFDLLSGKGGKSGKIDTGKLVMARGIQLGRINRRGSSAQNRKREEQDGADTYPAPGAWRRRHLPQTRIHPLGAVCKGLHCLWSGLQRIDELQRARLRVYARVGAQARREAQALRKPTTSKGES